jgi:hypothetical protein
VPTSSYFAGRAPWARPQGMIWANTPNLISVGADGLVEEVDFIVISDHNRSPIRVEKDRIESRSRMINGTMRSYHTADKLVLSTSWERLPSRAFSEVHSWDSNGVTTIGNDGTQYTADGGAGGVALLDWYESHPGPFWVYLAYDKYTNFNNDIYHHLDQYTEVRHMYFANFGWSIEKRGANNYDMWSIDVSLEEV